MSYEHSVSSANSCMQKQYTGKFVTMDAFDFRSFISRHTAFHCADIRPFEVVMKYMAKMGYRPARSETDSLVIVYERYGEQQARNISLARLLHICADKSREAQNEARKGFARMCAEEDEDEIDLILTGISFAPKR